MVDKAPEEDFLVDFFQVSKPEKKELTIKENQEYDHNRELLHCEYRKHVN